MKRNIIFLSVMSIFILVSCIKEEETIYSCDNEINKYVNKNLDNLSNISYENLIVFPLEYQKAIYRSLSPKKRYEMWQAKLNWVLSNKAYSDPIKDHIKMLLQDMKISWFDETQLGNEDFTENLSDYLISWVVYSINELGLNEKDVYFMVVRLSNIETQNMSLKDKNNVSNNEKNNNSLKTSGQGTCTCSIESDWCDVLGSDLGDCSEGANDCIPSTLGCGTLWTFSCDGECVLGHFEE